MFIKIYDQVSGFLRRAKYSQLDSQIESYQLKPKQIKKQLSQIKLQPGQAIFFWNKKINYVDHIAIVPKQKKDQLNLLEAKLIQAIPPATNDEQDYSGVRACSALEFIGHLTTTYSRIIVGTPPTTNHRQLKKAGRIAKKISISGKIDNKVVLYSLPFFNKFFYVKWFDFDTHLKFKIGFPYLVAKKEAGKATAWMSTYCGDLVGRIYHQARIKNLPQIKFLGQLYFRSSTFYEWMKDENQISYIIMWGDQKPHLY